MATGGLLGHRLPSSGGTGSTLVVPPEGPRRWRHTKPATSYVYTWFGKWKAASSGFGYLRSHFPGACERHPPQVGPRGRAACVTFHACDGEATTSLDGPVKHPTRRDPILPPIATAPITSASRHNRTTSTLYMCYMTGCIP